MQTHLSDGSLFNHAHLLCACSWDSDIFIQQLKQLELLKQPEPKKQQDFENKQQKQKLDTNRAVNKVKLHKGFLPVKVIPHRDTVNFLTHYLFFQSRKDAQDL